MPNLLDWLFRRVQEAERRIAAAAFQQRLHEHELSLREKPDLKPYPLRLRYDQDQRTIAIYQRVLKSFTHAKKRPPKNLRELVNAKSR